MRRSYFQRSTGGSEGERPRLRGLQGAVKRGGVAVLALVLLLVVAFYVSIGVQGVNPPVLAVQGNSMRPSLSNGDLAVLRYVTPAALRRGDVIAITVPLVVRARTHLSPHVERRIVGVVHSAHGVRFRTKADANARPDHFEVLPSEIVGEVTGSIPLVGYIFLFFGTPPGDVFLASLAIVAAISLLARWSMRRQPELETSGATVTPARGDAERVSTGLAAGEVGPGRAERSALSLEEEDRTASGVEELLAEMRSTSRQSRYTAEVLRELVGAVSEYGAHLRSHTAVMRNLAATTNQLNEAVTRLTDAVTTPRPMHGLWSERWIGAQTKTTATAPRDEGDRDEHDARPPVIDAEAWREPFTASELRWPNLARTADGYPAEQVDRLLDRAADALDLVERERNSLRDRLLVVETRLAMLTEQQESIVEARIAQREAHRVAERARHEATVALHEATRRAAEIARDVDEERRSLLGIAKELGGQLLATGPLPGSGSPAGTPTVPGTPSRSDQPPPAGPAAPAAHGREAAPSEPFAPGADESPMAPEVSMAHEAGTPPAPPSAVERREPPGIPPVWPVTPSPSR